MLSAEEIYAEGASVDKQRASRRFAIKIAAIILLLFALTVGALYVMFAGKLRRERPAQTNAATLN